MSILSVFQGFFKKRHGNSFEDPEISQEAARRSLEIRELKHKTRILEHEALIKREQLKIKRLEEELSEGEEEEEQPIDPMMLSILGMLFSGKSLDSQNFDLTSFIPGLQQSQGSAKISQPGAVKQLPPMTETELSEGEIQAMINKMDKKYLKIARGLPPEIIKAYCKKNFDYSEQTIEKAIEIIKR